MPELGRTVADELLEPTRIYVRAVKTVYRRYRVKRIVQVCPASTGADWSRIFRGSFPTAAGSQIRRGSWTVPKVFPWLQSLGSVGDQEWTESSTWELAW